MNRHFFRIGLAVLVALTIVLAALWFHSDGRVRNVQWKAPLPQPQNFLAMIPTLAPREKADTRRFLAMLERPLFSPVRRPPPPPPPAAPPEEQHPFPNVHLFGLYGGDSGGGAVVSLNGKNQRLRINESIAGWRLSAIGNRFITLQRGSTSKNLELINAIPVPGPSATAGPPVSNKPQKRP